MVFTVYGMLTTDEYEHAYIPAGDMDKRIVLPGITFLSRLAPTKTHLTIAKMLECVIHKVTTYAYLLLLYQSYSQTYRVKSCVVLANRPSGISVSLLL